jgi:ethanolamine utilization protein EutQ (cupin superfamily)
LGIRRHHTRYLNEADATHLLARNENVPTTFLNKNLKSKHKKHQNTPMTCVITKKKKNRVKVQKYPQMKTLFFFYLF